MTLKVRTSQDVLDNLMRVPVPNVVPRGLPLWMASRSGERALILEAGVLPPNVVELDRINLPVKIFVVGDRWQVAVRNERGGPQFEELVDLLLREFSIGEHKLGEFETSPGCERRPIVVCLHSWYFSWGVWGDRGSMPITALACRE